MKDVGLLKSGLRIGLRIEPALHVVRDYDDNLVVLRWSNWPDIRVKFASTPLSSSSFSGMLWKQVWRERIKWSKNKPTEDGYYLVRDYNGAIGTFKVVDVREWTLRNPIRNSAITWALEKQIANIKRGLAAIRETPHKYYVTEEYIDQLERQQHHNFIVWFNFIGELLSSDKFNRTLWCKLKDVTFAVGHPTPYACIYKSYSIDDDWLI